MILDDIICLLACLLASCLPLAAWCIQDPKRGGKTLLHWLYWLHRLGDLKDNARTCAGADT